MAEKKIDEATGVETTGHEWDGVSELNNPMPRWWVSIFYATIVWGVVYTILYPAWPLVSTATAGLLGYSTRGEVAERIEAHREMQSQWRDRIDAAELDEILEDQELLRFAMAAGRANFAVNCSQCHGAGGGGNPGGYPNLNDDAWIWGGEIGEIYLTIAHGVRNEDDPDARFSMMPAYGVEEMLDRAAIADVAEHVLSLSGRETDAEAAARGEEIFVDNCAACHGEAGEGGPMMGAPSLADAIWLYGGEKDDIVAQVWSPRHGVMPPWIDRLGEVAVKELAVYVHSLGGGR